MGLNLLVEPQPLNSAPVLSFLIFSWKLKQSTDLALKQIEMSGGCRDGSWGLVFQSLLQC